MLNCFVELIKEKKYTKNQYDCCLGLTFANDDFRDISR